MNKDIEIIKENKGIITTMKGGLGNQMFEVAVGYALSLEYKLHFYIGIYSKNTKGHSCINKHNFNNNNYYDSIFNYFFTNSIRLVNSKHYNILKNNNYLYTKCINSNIYKPNNGIIISGYFQNYNLFYKYENEIRGLFLRGLEKYIDLMKNKYDTENTAFLHIRRGDYLKCQWLFKQPTMRYYKNCVKRLRDNNKEIKKIFIFTNDLIYAKSKSFFKRPIFKIIHEKDELNTIGLMSLCKAGAIITNSTFGWWGAFLGAYESRNPVYVFKRWFVSSPMQNICPAEWIKV